MRRPVSGGGHPGLSSHARVAASANGRVAVVLSLIGVALAGCTTILGIDGEYTEEKSVQLSTGGTKSASGGVSGGGIRTGGATAHDGAVNPASGGETTASGGTAPLHDADLPRCLAGTGECGDGMKCCDGTCVPVEPLSGCGAAACSPCPRPPDFGIVICDDGACVNRCIDGRRLAGEAPQVCELVAPNTGGASGSGGASSGGSTATGGAPACTPETCQTSGARCLNLVIGALHCCKNDNTCGCTWAPNSPRGVAPYCL